MTKKKLIAGLLATVLITATSYASTKARWKAGHLEYFESRTQETVQALTPVQYQMPMISASNVTIPAYNGAASTAEVLHLILSRNTAGTTKYLQAVHGGGIELALSDTSRKEEAVVYKRDLKMFDIAKDMAVEIVAALPTFNTAAAATGEVAFGLRGNYAEGLGVDTPAVMFATSTVLGDNWHAVFSDSEGRTVTDTGVARDTKENAFRIELYEPGKVRFFINGNSVASGDIHATSTLVQPYVMAYKEAGTAEVKLNLKRYHIWADR